MKHKIAVLDFGGQYAHLIANRIRRLGVYSEIVDNETPAAALEDYAGIVLSGGPDSVNEPGAPRCDRAIFELKVPILAICYGHQLMQHTMGGKVEKGDTREYGMATFNVARAEGIFADFKAQSKVWMSHFDTVKVLADGFEAMGSTLDCPTAAVADLKRNYFGVQFHAEVTHTEEGMQLLDNFLALCHVERHWNISAFIKEEVEAIKEKIGEKKVFLLVSGGVDSTVCFALLEKALGPERVYGMLVDTGLMRLNEAEKVKEALKAAGFTNLHVADKKALFLEKLKGVSDPEEKRKIIGELFWEVKESVAEELGLNGDEWIMGQGTIYPDTIESGGTKHADKIKTHHNRVDLVQQMIAEGKVIEPIAQLYKDEVRELGEELGLPHDLVWRHPFPGPGLGVRILCTSEEDLKINLPGSDDNAYRLGHVHTEGGRRALEVLSAEVTDFVIRESGFKAIQAKVLPCKSVGVQGDERTYAHPVALFTELRDWEQLERMSTMITNHFPQVNRVMLCLQGELGTFELKVADINAKRVEILQQVDDQVAQVMQKAPEDYGIWQFPVVLVPVSTKKEKESVVLRPIVSTEAMTASFARIETRVLLELLSKIKSEDRVSHVFYDLTHKPPGTIEWE